MFETSSAVASLKLMLIFVIFMVSDRGTALISRAGAGERLRSELSPLKSGLAEEDSPTGRYDDLDNTRLATGNLLNIRQKAFEIGEFSPRWSEDVKSLLHIKSALEASGTRTHILLRRTRTVSRRVKEVVNPRCSQGQQQVSQIKTIYDFYIYV